MKVVREFRNTSGIKLFPKYNKFKNVSYIEQRHEDVKALEDKIKVYKENFDSLKKVSFEYNDTNNERIRAVSGESLKTNYDTIDEFNTYMSEFEGQDKILLSEADMVGLESMYTQKSSLTAQISSLEQQCKAYEYSERATCHSISTWDNTKDDVKYPVDSEGNTAKYNSISSQRVYDSTYYDNLKRQVGTPSDASGVTENMFEKQREIACEQMQICEDQKTLIQQQIELLIEKGNKNIEQTQSYYVEYLGLLKDLEEAKKKIPENYVVVGNLTKGFNADGDLVVIFDDLENYVVIEYECYIQDPDKKYHVSKMYDNTGKKMEFYYNDKEMLVSIIDTTGSITSYEYVNSYVLRKIIGANGTVELKNYAVESSKFSVTNVDCNLSALFDLNATSSKKISQYSISHAEDVEETSREQYLLCEHELTCSSDEDFYVSQIHEKKANITEKYCFTKTGYLHCTGYYLEEDGVVTRAEQYQTIPYWSGRVKNSEPKTVTKYAQKSLLNTTSLEEFVFGDTCEYEDVITPDENELPIREVRGARKIPGTDNTIAETIDYEYSKDLKKIKETCKKTITIGEDVTEITEIVEYAYDEKDRVKQAISYVEGEENELGKSVSVKEYDEKGRVTREYNYNTLDSSDKFYTQSEYDENDNVIAEYSEDSQKTEIKYLNNGLIREEILPNGSKFSYGYDERGRLTAVTQSAKDGIENNVNRKYEFGRISEVSCGNAKVNYSYDIKGRISEVNVNDSATPTHTYVYEDDVDYQIGENSIKADVVTDKRADNKVVRIYLDKKGNVLKVDTANRRVVNGVESLTSVKTLIKNEYDDKKRLVKYTDSSLSTDVVETFGYLGDTDKVLTFSRGEYTETNVYDGYGALSGRTDTVSGIEYGYEYKNNSKRNIDKINLSINTATIPETISVTPKRDVYGRNVGARINVGNVDIAEDTITYKKMGDHATILPASISYKNLLSSEYSLTPKYVVNERMTYEYDNMGNVKEIRENGKLTTRYHYDGLSRLIREDNKAFGKTYKYEYDDNGNRLFKREYAYTLCSMKDLINEEEIDVVEYLYDGDKLIFVKDSMGITAMTYNAMGMPTQYGMNTSVVRDRITSMKSIITAYDARERVKYFNTSHSNELTYDGEGRISSLKISKFSGESVGEMKFLFDDKGRFGFIFNDVAYTYRKDVFGNVIAILDENGSVVVRYSYDAWGKHVAYDSYGYVISDEYHIGLLNPYRYRSYYYVDDGMYWLNTRFYDSATGRFVSPDDLSYLDPDSVNGLNLYAYCANNPIAYSDPSGHVILSFLIGLGISTLLTWGISELVGNQIAGGISSVASGSMAVYTGIGLLSFGPFGWIAGGALIIAGSGNVIFGVNEIVEGVTGTNYIKEWTGMSDGLYDGIYLGLNITSSVGTLASNIYFAKIRTNALNGLDNAVYGIKAAKHIGERSYYNSILTQQQIIKGGKIRIAKKGVSGYEFRIKGYTAMGDSGNIRAGTWSLVYGDGIIWHFLFK